MGEQLFQAKDAQLEFKKIDLTLKDRSIDNYQVELKTKTDEVERLKNEKIANDKSIREDMMTVRNSVDRSNKLNYGTRNYGMNYWTYVPARIKTKYNLN